MKQYPIVLFILQLGRLAQRNLFVAFLAICAVCTMYTSAVAQTVNKMRDVIPPSPDAAALGKYGLYPVTLSNGLVGIDIPIYTIKTNTLEMPISVSYHASGIKVDEVASVVGLGWSLNAGGVITRVVRDRPDARFGIIAPVHDKAFYDAFTNSIVYSELDYIAGGVQGIDVDTESDIYYYNVNGLTGSFRYDTQGNLVQLPLSNNKIAFNYEQDEFTLTATDGTVYTFSDRERGTQGAVDNMIVDPFTTSWYLTRILTADGEALLFTYQDDATIYNVWSEGIINRECADGFTLGEDCSQGSGNGAEKTYSRVETRLTKVLKSISFPGGAINFSISADRLDRRKYRVLGMSISNRAGRLVRSVSFEQSYFWTGSAGGGPLRSRLKLDAVQVGAERYAFAYNTRQLPEYYEPNGISGSISNYAQDYWGYYNAAGNSNFNTMVPPSPATPIFPLANRAINEDAAQACILKKITYPTGGTTEFTYQSNRGMQNELVGGLRVYQITSLDNAGRRLIKTYRYESPLPNFSDPRDIVGSTYSKFVWHQDVGYEFPIFVMTYFESQPPAPLTYEGGAAVFYGKVTEFIGTEENYSGKTVTLFSAIQDFEFNGANLENSFPFMPNGRPFYPKYKYDSFNFAWRRGQPSRISVFSRENGVEKLIKETNHVYSELMYNNYVKVGFYAFKFRVALTARGMSVPEDAEAIRSYHFQFDDIVIKTGIKKLMQTTETDMSAAGEISKVTTYSYDRLDNQYEATAITQQASDGSALKKTFQYPGDLQTRNAGELYTDMWRRNIISPVIVETDYKDAEMIRSVRNNYRPWGNYIYAPETTEEKVGAHGYETHVTYLGFDTYKNPVGIVKRDGVRETYLWGYQNLSSTAANNSYPVVKIEGPTELPVSEVLRSAIQSYRFSGALLYSELQPDVTFLNNQLATLRSNPYYKVTSYTYAPLIGMTSATDANGRTTYYEYDSFGRLTRVRDDEGKYLKMYDYKLVGQ
jgi:YD repeat-containing protein